MGSVYFGHGVWLVMFTNNGSILIAYESDFIIRTVKMIFLLSSLHLSELPKAFARLLRNPIYLITCLGICCEVCIVSGFVVFLPKYLETQFTLSKSVANLLTGKSAWWASPLAK